MVNITCQTDSTKPIAWTFYPQDGKNTLRIHTGTEHLLKRYRVISGTTSTLIIDNVQLNDAGQYECSEYSGPSENVVNFKLNVTSKITSKHHFIDSETPSGLSEISF